MKTITHVQSDLAYNKFERALHERVRNLRGPLFTTSATSLMSRYLVGIDVDRQHYNCRRCTQFVERYGGLVTIDKLGKVQSALWAEDYPTFFRHSTELMREAVEGSKVTGVFLNESAVWGTPRTGVWTHMHGVPDLKVVEGAGQVMAEKHQDYIMVSRGLVDIRVDAVREAVRVLEADALDRSEKTLGVARWLLALMESVDGKRSQDRQNLIWLAVAAAPPGWCHLQTAVIRTLIDDISDGMSYEQVSARWSAKMHPLQYQRPTAPPKGGQIERANRLMEELKFAGSLSRRFAKLDEVTAYWKPVPPLGVPAQDQGFFDSLRSPAGKKVQPLVMKAIKMTWERFRIAVLPEAHELEVEAPARGSYFGMVTCDNRLAPPILQWDREDQRNPVSWFFFSGGSDASDWSLRPLAWVKVNAVCHSPCHWSGGFDHHLQAAFLVLEGAHLTERESHGGLFPEILRSEFREIRHVMEAYANLHPVTGALEGTANGYAFQRGQEYNVVVRVNGTDMYVIDRWE